MIASVTMMLVMHGAYKYANGRLSNREPAYLDETGAHLVPVWAPALKPSDASDPRFADIIANGDQFKIKDLQSGLIEITASKAKSARRRFVKIQPNLSKWLQPYVQGSGSVTSQVYRVFLEGAREAARIEQWPQNTLRHSFASYHLASFNDAVPLALELGHTNSNVVFNIIGKLAKPKKAERYWKIAPAAAGKKLIQFAAAQK